jgi:hypothetical protein
MSYLRNPNGKEKAPLLGTERALSSSGGSSGLLSGIIGVLVVVAIAGIALTITFGVLYGNEKDARQPKYSGRTVPQAVNDAVDEWLFSLTCGDQVDQVIGFPNLLARMGDNRAQIGCNTTIKIDPHYLKSSLTFNSPQGISFQRLKNKVTPYLGTGAMTRAQEEFLRLNTGREQTDVWSLKPVGGTPEKCQKFYAAKNLFFGGAQLAGGWIKDTTVEWFGIGTGFPFVDPELSQIIWTPGIGLYNNTSVQMITEALLVQQNMYRESRLVNLATGINDDYIELTGLSRPLESWNEDLLTETIALLFYWNSVDFGAGSSILYDQIILMFARSGYFPSPSELSAIQNAIIGVETEAVNYVNYLTTTIPTFPVVTVPASTFINFDEDYTTRWAKMLPNSVWADCGRDEKEGVYVRNHTAAFLNAQAEILAARAVAEPILIAQVPDYLGWQLTYVHFNFGTEAGVTDLGYYSLTDCAPYDGTATAYIDGAKRRNEARSRLGEIANTFSQHPIRDGHWWTRSTTFCGNEGKPDRLRTLSAPYGEHDHRKFGLVAFDPSLPYKTDMVYHMYLEIDSHEQALSGYQCPSCHYYRTVAPIAGNLFQASYTQGQTILGKANYMNSIEVLQDLGGIVGSGTLDEAMFALFRGFEAEQAGAFYGVMTGQTTPADWAAFVEANSWYPFGDLTLATEVISTVGEAPLTASFCAFSGKDRLIDIRKKINAKCPGQGKRVLDAMLALPRMPISAIEIAIDDYIATGCKNWPYEESPYLTQVTR